MAEDLVEQSGVGLALLVGRGEKRLEGNLEALSAATEPTGDRFLHPRYNDCQQEIGEYEADGDVEDGFKRHGSAPSNCRLPQQVQQHDGLIVEGVVAAAIVAPRRVRPVAQEVGTVWNVAVCGRRIVLVRLV